MSGDQTASNGNLHLFWHADQRDPWKVRNANCFVVAEFNSAEDAAACVEAVNGRGDLLARVERLEAELKSETARADGYLESFKRVNDFLSELTGQPVASKPPLSPTPLDVCPFCGADDCRWDCIL